jgi:transcriptional antiterminator RfaH
MKQWFVVHTQPLKEGIAEEHLKQQGFGVYFPRFSKTTRHARQTKKTFSPLFPRYLFVSFELETDRWRNINGTRGVAYLLSNGERPIVVPTDVVNELKNQEDTEGLIPISGMQVFVRGDKVRVLEGAFKDYTATFEKLDDKQRVQLLLSFLGREMKISLSANDIEAA